MEKIIHYPEFVTATILNWHPLLKQEKYKNLILESLRFLVKSNRIILYAYCIMDTHIHLIWQVKGDIALSVIRRDFFKYTAQQFKRDLDEYDPEVLISFASTQADRKYQIWERNTLCIDLFTDAVFDQKLNYIHYNPVAAGICLYEEEYTYSSARFYLTGEDRWNMMTHCNQ